MTVDKADTTRKVISMTVILQDLGNSISGQVYYKRAGGSSALLDGKVEFHLKDSLSSPRSSHHDLDPIDRLNRW